MSKKNAKRLSLIFIIFVSIWFMKKSIPMVNLGDTTTFGPGYFPFWLSIFLFILSGIRLIVTFIEKDDEKIFKQNYQQIIITILTFIIFVLIWSQFGYFYLVSFLFLFFLLSVYQSAKRWQAKVMITNCGISVAFILFIYLLFDLIMQANF